MQPLVRARVISSSDREVPIFRIMRIKSPMNCNPRVADRLSPYHDSQFSAFSTEVLIWFRPGHNHISSPFNTLPDVAERRVASTGAGQPNYWRKTWFGANAYNAKFGVPNLSLRSVRTLLPYYGAQWSPWLINAYQSVWVRLDKIINKKQQQIRVI